MRRHASESKKILSYLDSDADEPDSELDDGAGTDEEVADDEGGDDDDLDEQGDVADESIEVDFAEEVDDVNSVERYLADQNLRDEFMSAVHLGEEGESGRAETRRFEAAFRKLRLDKLERFSKTRQAAALEDLVNNLRISMTSERRTRRTRFRVNE